MISATPIQTSSKESFLLNEYTTTTFDSSLAVIGKSENDVWFFLRDIKLEIFLYFLLILSIVILFIHFSREEKNTKLDSLIQPI